MQTAASRLAWHRVTEPLTGMIGPAKASLDGVVCGARRLWCSSQSLEPPNCPAYEGLDVTEAPEADSKRLNAPYRSRADALSRQCEPSQFVSLGRRTAGISQYETKRPFW